MCSDPSNKIQTEPVLIHNTVARNFNGLKLSVKFQLAGDYYSWTHPGLNRRQNTIYSKFLQPACGNKSENNFRVTCQQVSCGELTYIISSLTLMFSLTKRVTFSVYLQNSPVEVASVDVNVKGKSTCLADNLRGHIQYHLCAKFQSNKMKSSRKQNTTQNPFAFWYNQITNN